MRIEIKEKTVILFTNGAIFFLTDENDHDEVERQQILMRGSEEEIKKILLEIREGYTFMIGKWGEWIHEITFNEFVLLNKWGSLV